MAHQPPSHNLRTVPYTAASKDRTMQSMEQLVLDICNPNLRDNAISELAKKHKKSQDLAPVLWNSFGTTAVLLQEIITVYPFLSPPTLTEAASTRICNALALFKCVASHPNTRMLFLNTRIPVYLYPFLNTTIKTKPFEGLRVFSLAVIGELVQVENPEVIKFLLSTEIVPLCLRSMEMGSELSKTIATFILKKILLDNLGLEYICQTLGRFLSVANVLANMVAALPVKHSQLLQLIIMCYRLFCQNPRGRDALRTCFPQMLRDGTFNSCLREDQKTRWVLQELLYIMQGIHDDMS